MIVVQKIKFCKIKLSYVVVLNFLEVIIIEVIDIIIDNDIVLKNFVLIDDFESGGLLYIFLFFFGVKVMFFRNIIIIEGFVNGV